MASLQIPRALFAGLRQHDTRASRSAALGRQKIRQAAASTRPISLFESLENRCHLTAVTRFVLVDAVTNQDLFQIDTSKPLNLAALSNKLVNVRADGDSTTGSVSFFLNGEFVRTENAIPYALFSDTNGDYNSWAPTPGNFTLSAVPYSEDFKGGVQGPTASIPFTVIDQPVNVVQQQVTGFTLYNADTDQPIRPLVEGESINLGLLPTRNISIKAETTSKLGSMAFDWNGRANFYVDPKADYFMRGDSGFGNIYAWIPISGRNTLTARPVNTNPLLAGQFIGKTLNFTIVNVAGTAPTVTLVNPVANTVKTGLGQFVILASASDKDGVISKIEFYANNMLIGSTTDLPYSLAWTDVQPGTYNVTAKAFDNSGLSTVSSGVSVTVKPFTTDRFFYVSPTGNDANPGTQASPLRTINRAASLATAGSTVLIGPGTYRESVWLGKAGTPDKPITFKAITPGTVVLDGADVISGWTPETGSIYSTNWSYDFFLAGLRTHGKTFDGTQYAEQFMVGNKMLKRVETSGLMFEGAFWINYDTDKVYVWLPNSADARTTQVLGSTRSTLFAPAKSAPGTAANIRVEGLTFRRAANFTQPQQAGVRTDNGWVITDSTFQYMNSTGIGVFGNDVTLLRVHADYNGQSGISSAMSRNVLVKDSTTIGNNSRQVRVDFEGGGGKWARANNVYLLNVTSGDNMGHGIWFDTENSNIVVMNSRVYNNVGFAKPVDGTGLFSELNPGPVRFEGNYAYGMTSAAIRVAESWNTIIKNNILIDNMRGVEIRDMVDRPYSVKNVKIIGNKFRGWGESAIGTLQGVWNSTASSRLNIVIENNVYDLTGSTIKRMFRWGPASYKTISDYHNALGFEDNGKLASITAPA